MQEESRVTLSRSTSFEESGQRITVSISMEGCKKEDYRKIIPVAGVMFNKVVEEEFRDALGT
ncbi:hypothetical protein [Selenomonas sp. F0473]|uniref:hypothetical protein n=1 Tax=Selenomonas sp. F0473 TaxID=999423 RepID=UPI0025FDB172|nr:hypothetical protein [Selenomonas sp. F0473]